jgi:acetyl esterase
MTETQVDIPTRAFLDMLIALGGPPLYEQTVGDVRKAVSTLHAQLGGTREAVHRVADHTVPVAGGDIAVRVYSPRPPAAGDGVPIVMHYHGGGFVAGDLESHDGFARYCCKHADVVVVSVDYRLAPEHKFPAAVEDSYAALCWAVDRAGELGGDATRVAVIGDSAGGNLAAVMCQLARARGGPRIAFQALLYPTMDCGSSAEYPSRRQFGGGEYFLSNRDMEWFTSLYLSDVTQEVTDLRASPLLAEDLTGLPPAVIVTAGCDLLRDEGRAYADRLAAAGVPVEYRCFEHTIHAFVSFNAAIPAGQEALAFVVDRLRTALSAVQRSGVNAGG